MEIARAVQQPPDLDSIRQFALENQKTSEAIHAPRTNFREAQVSTPPAQAGTASEKSEAVIRSLQERTCGTWIVAADMAVDERALRMVFPSPDSLFTNTTQQELAKPFLLIERIK